jgi:hypothetical protein
MRTATVVRVARAVEKVRVRVERDARRGVAELPGHLDGVEPELVVSEVRCQARLKKGVPDNAGAGNSNSERQGIDAVGRTDRM